jgi:Peptidase propeptide and YPEB domain
MTPTAEAEAGHWGTRLTPRQPVWVRVGFIVVVLALAFVVAQTCQKSQIRYNKNQAIAKAERQVDFTPQRTQIRLLRQGLNSKPYWIVSLSTPGKVEGTFHNLAVVRIDANTGKVVSVKQPTGSAKQ